MAASGNRTAPKQDRETVKRAGEIKSYQSFIPARDPKSQHWETYPGFPTLTIKNGQPKYLISFYHKWIFIVNSTYTGKSLIIPGYREDWKITVNDAARMNTISICPVWVKYTGGHG